MLPILSHHRGMIVVLANTILANLSVSLYYSAITENI
jgi:hypothetical protein